MRELFDATVERLFADLVTADTVLACEGSDWPATLWTALAESGFPLALAPEAQGGAGASWSDVCGALRLCGRYNLPLPLAETMLANWLLGRCGLDAATDAVSIVATGSLQLADGVVSGVARDVPWGRQVTQVLGIIAGASPTLVLLPVASAVLAPSTNTAAEPRDTLTFMAVTPLAMAALPAGFSADDLKLGGAMLRSAQIAGALEGVLAMSTAYAADRVQFGKPIGSFQAIQHQVAVLAEHAAAAVMAVEAAFAQTESHLPRLQVMAAKICASEAAGIAAGVAHAVHGAIGFTHEYPLHLTTRRLWAWRSEYGSATDWSQQLGRAVCAGGAQAFWPGIVSGHFMALDSARDNKPENDLEASTS